MTVRVKLREKIASRFNRQGSLKFAQAIFSDPRRTGAVAPSSSHLARVMAENAYIQPDGKLLELGPGTGSITKALVKAGVSEENLVLLELDDGFADYLAKKYPKATILQKDAFEAVADFKADGTMFTSVVSGLPLINQPKHKRAQIARDALDIIVPEGSFVQFTYQVYSPVPRDDAIIATRSRRIWGNIPSAVVWKYQRAG
ncbi:MAG: rRNA adenine N-6-methyltransferase family protein [Pseudomonadota bacterium]